jgi:hypothetical protein
VLHAKYRSRPKNEGAARFEVDNLCSPPTADHDSSLLVLLASGRTISRLLLENCLGFVLGLPQSQTAQQKQTNSVNEGP